MTESDRMILQELEESARLGDGATPGPWNVQGPWWTEKGVDRFSVESADDVVAMRVLAIDGVYIAYHSPDRIARWRKAFAEQAEELRLLRAYFETPEYASGRDCERERGELRRQIDALRAGQQKGDVSDE